MSTHTYTPEEILYFHRINLLRGYLSRFMDTLDLKGTPDPTRIESEFQTIQGFVANTVEAGHAIAPNGGRLVAPQPITLAVRQIDPSAWGA